MGIILNVLPRPLAGHEAEFEQLVDWIDTSHYGNPAQPHPYTIRQSTGLFGWGRKKDVFDTEAAVARFHKISEHPGVTLKAPIVGRDADANEWAQQAYEKGWLAADNARDVVTKYNGLFVFDLLPIGDGFPVYSPSFWDKGYDRPSFYGAVIDAFDELLGAELVAYLHGPLLASELAEWAGKLRRWADEYARTHQRDAILGDRDFVSPDDGGADTCLHIVDQAARWAAFWSDLGHGAEPVFEP